MNTHIRSHFGRITLSLSAVALICIPASFVFAAISITSATVDGTTAGTYGSYDPSESISATVNVTTTGSGTDNDWNSTKWRVGTGAYSCVNHSNHTSSGSYNETFTITAPSTAGTYDVDFVGYNNDTCDGTVSGSVTLTGAVTVLQPFADTFDTSDNSTFSGAKWSDPPGVDDTSITGSSAVGEDQTRNANDSNKFAKIGDDNEYICATVNTSGFYGLTLKYFWKQDSSADGSSDHGIVEYKTAGSCSDGTDGTGWTQINSHELDSSSPAWSSEVSTSLSSGLNNSSFLLRFRNNANSADEYFRVDDVVVTGSATPPSATLNVIKHVVTDNGGTAVAGDWTLAVNSSNGGTGTGSAAGSESGTAYTLEVGKAYAVTESGGPSGYTQSDSSECVIASAGAGATYTCTITNDDQPGTLIVNKVVINDNGGSTATSTFSFKVNDGTSVFFESDAQNSISENAGSYSVVEDATTAYTAMYSNSINGNADCNNLSIAIGATVTCTITNNDIAPTLTLVKLVNNTGAPEGEEAAVTDWTLTATGPTTISGASGDTAITSATVPAGSYTLSESSIPHYAPSTGWVCSGVDAQDGSSIVLASGGNATCTITNAYVPPGTITIVKNTTGGDGTFSFSSGELGVFSLTTVGGVASQTFSNLEPGTYSVTEDTLPAGWEAGSASCTGDQDPSSISLTSDATIVCTFNNVKKGHIIVKKEINPTGDDQLFTFTPSWGENFSIAGGEQIASSDLSPGVYSVSESVPTGWVQTSATCDDGSGVSAINVAAGETVTCTFTNSKLPVLTIVKDIRDGTGSFHITLTPEHEGEPVNIVLYNNEGTHLSESSPLRVGTWNVVESGQEGWQLAYVSCEYNGNSIGTPIDGGRTITLNYGDNVTCTFVNTQRAVIHVNKNVINDNGGTRAASDFSFQLSNNGESVGEPIAFDEDGNGYVIVDGGESNTYTITETAVSGYTTSYDGCSNIVLASHGSTNCTITNNDIAPAQSTPPASPVGNGPIVGVEGIGFNGQVLGASTTTSPTGGQVLGASTTGGACTALITQIPMGVGLSNNTSQVKALQEFLNGEVQAGLPVSGVFGQLTKAAVSKFQLKYWQEVLAPWVPFGLPTDHTPTGYVSKTTAWKINMIHCPSLGLPFPALP